MSRIAIVGVEGSGKTVLMAALGDMFGQPSADALYLMPESQSSFSFMTQIPHKMKEEHQWPSATAIESMKHLKWTVRIGQRVLADLEMLDYPGELYRLAFGERKEKEIEPHREKVHEFLEHLVTADTLVVLLNLKDAMNVGASAKNNETVWLTRGIFDYAKKLPNIKKCLLLFTQADRYPAELNGPGGVQAAKEKYMPMLHVLYPNLECAAVAVATDESDAPAKEFSAAHGVAEFMQWMVLHTEEGEKAKAVLEECTAVAKKNDGSSANILRCNELLGKLAAIPTGLAKMIMPSGLDELRTTLNTLLEQAMEAEKKASILQQEAEKRKALADLFASCDACRKRANEAPNIFRIKTEVNNYGDVLESLRKHDPTTWHESDLATYQSHKTYHAQLNSFIEFVENFKRGKKARVLAKKQTWEPVKLRFPDDLCCRMMEREREDNANQVQGQLVAIMAYVTIVCAMIIAGVVSRINQQRREARAERDRAEAQAMAELEKDAQKARNDALNSKAAADKAGAQEVDASSYAMALDQLNNGETEYGKKMFRESSNSWRSAAISFQSLEATKEKLNPNLRIEVTAGGTLVNANIEQTGGPVAVRDNYGKWRLEKGGQYTFEVSYVGGGKQWKTEERTFTANWTGDISLAVVLEKVTGPSAGEVRVIDLGGGVNLEMVWIEPGNFMMGSPPGESQRENDETQHRVTLTEGFWMGKYEVTQEQWERVMGSNPSTFKGARNPVERVSWEDCQEFIRKLNSRVSGGGFRLPTEAEWEDACRAGSTGPFAFGHCLSTSAANYDGGYPLEGCGKGEHRRKTLPVGSLRANLWGLYDMHGNVLEWCQDWYGDYPSGAVTNPPGPGSGQHRVCRGGRWTGIAKGCRSADRGWFAPGLRSNDLSLRLARSNHP